MLHRGDYAVESIAGHLVPDVTMAPLLLKNSVADVVDHSGYAIITRAAVQYLEILLEGSLPHREHYEHYPPIESYIFPL